MSSSQATRSCQGLHTYCARVLFAVGFLQARHRDVWHDRDHATVHVHNCSKRRSATANGSGHGASYTFYQGTHNASYFSGPRQTTTSSHARANLDCHSLKMQSTVSLAFLIDVARGPGQKRIGWQGDCPGRWWATTAESHSCSGAGFVPWQTPPRSRRPPTECG